jgi:hypothetical protein
MTYLPLTIVMLVLTDLSYVPAGSASAAPPRVPDSFPELEAKTHEELTAF